jgi:hypothetical protein
MSGKIGLVDKELDHDLKFAHQEEMDAKKRFVKKFY